MRAFDIDPDSVSRSRVRKILKSDPTDSKSNVNSLDDDRFVAFRRAFNFDSDGGVTVPLQAMLESVVEIRLRDWRHASGAIEKSRLVSAWAGTRVHQEQISG